MSSTIKTPNIHPYFIKMQTAFCGLHGTGKRNLVFMRCVGTAAAFIGLSVDRARKITGIGGSVKAEPYGPRAAGLDTARLASGAS